MTVERPLWEISRLFGSPLVSTGAARAGIREIPRPSCLAELPCLVSYPQKLQKTYQIRDFLKRRHICVTLCVHRRQKNLIVLGENEEIGGFRMVVFPCIGSRGSSFKKNHGLVHDRYF